MWNCDESFSSSECKYAMGEVQRLFFEPSFQDAVGNVPVCVTCPTGAHEPKNLQADPNWCKMVTDIKTYYKNTTKESVDPTSLYFADCSSIAQETKAKLNRLSLRQMRENGVIPLISSDMDDTIWNTFAESVEEGFCFDPEDFDKFSFERKMPPVPPAISVLSFAVSLGIVPVFITGRAATREESSLTQRQLAGPHFNLRGGIDYWGGPLGWQGNHGQDIGDGQAVQSLDGVFFHSGRNTRTSGGLSSSEYKIKTREFIERNGLPGVGRHVKFVAAQGDQWSDSGPFGGFRVKLPNPMYFLP